MSFYEAFEDESAAKQWIEEFREQAKSEAEGAREKVLELLDSIKHFSPSVRKDQILAMAIEASKELSS